jgi:dCTP deaminase
MRLLTKDDLSARFAKTGDQCLRIDPLLDKSQIGEVTIDLRLGADFIVSILTRKPFINTAKVDDSFRDINTYFNITRRDIGDTFILYPDQVVLGTTLEYVCLPTDCYADIISRSSYTRLGIHVNTMIQPGYRGCFGVELFNHGNSPVELIVGSRLFQMRVFELDQQRQYEAEGRRKYLGNVRPTASRAPEDAEHPNLLAIRAARG